MNACICGKSSLGQTDTILKTELDTCAYTWQFLWLAERSVKVNSGGWAVKTAPKVLIIAPNSEKYLQKQCVAFWLSTFFAVWANFVRLHRRYWKYLYLKKRNFSCLSPSAHTHWLSSGRFGIMCLCSRKNHGTDNLQICRWCCSADPYRHHDTGAELMVDRRGCGWVVTLQPLPLTAIEGFSVCTVSSFSLFSLLHSLCHYHPYIYVNTPSVFGSMASLACDSI